MKPEPRLDGKLIRNPGVALDLDEVMAVTANTSAIERRAATLGTRRTVKKDWQAAWLLKAVTCIDLTTLAGDDTEDRVRRLCRKARNPIGRELLDGSRGGRSRHHRRCGLRLSRHGRGGLRRRSRAAAFRWRRSRPAFRPGCRRSSSGGAEIEASVAAGAAEIDIVISRRHVLEPQLAGAL